MKRKGNELIRRSGRFEGEIERIECSLCLPVVIVTLHSSSPSTTNDISSQYERYVYDFDSNVVIGKVRHPVTAVSAVKEQEEERYKSIQHDNSIDVSS